MDKQIKGGNVQSKQGLQTGKLLLFFRGSDEPFRTNRYKSERIFYICLSKIVIR